ncbi:MAG: UbiA family prenyltransferase [Bacteroidales bacterium]|nr:UbiA family prenyltransferase [Bacteroidales bacterium]
MNIFLLFRIKDWIVSKFLFNLTLLLGISFFVNPTLTYSIKSVALLFIYIATIGAFGYFINDCFDIESDKKSGKTNVTDKIGLSLKILISFSLISVCVIFFYFSIISIKSFLYLLGTQVVLLLLYSVPETKIKQNIIGLIADALFSYVLPACITIFIGLRTFEWTFFTESYFFTAFFWLFILGLRSILMHQQKDYYNDTLAGNRTFTIQIGEKQAAKITGFLMIFEVILFVFTAFLLPYCLGTTVIIAFFLFVTIEWLNNVSLIKSVNNLNDISSFLNVYYNYYLFSALGLWLGIQINAFYLLFFAVFILIKYEKIYFLLEKFYHKVILFIYYKSKGVIRRIKKIFC